MFILNLSSVKESAKKLVKRFPIPFFFTILLNLVFLYAASQGDFSTGTNSLAYFSAMGLLVALLFSLVKEEIGELPKMMLAEYLLLVLFLADSLYLWGHLDGFNSLQQQEHFLARAAVVLCLTCCMIFLPFKKEKTDLKAWKQAVVLIQWGIISYFIGGIMYLGFAVLIGGLQKLFDIILPGETYAYLMVMCIGFLPILLILAHIPEKEERNQVHLSSKGFLVGVCKYLFLPLLSCYYLVLYAYMFKIIFTWKLPHGMLGTMVSVLMAGLLALIILLYPTDQAGKVREWVVKWLPLLALPLVILMSIGIGRRISDYGFTAPRLYILTLNLWFYVVCIGIYLTKARRLHWMVYSFSALFLLTSSQPLNYTWLTRNAKDRESVTKDKEQVTIDSIEQKGATMDHSGFVLLTDVVPDAIMEVRYYSTYNFTGHRIPGYEEPVVLLTREAADSLKAVSDELLAQGYRLKVFDGYRPQKAVDDFMEWAKNVNDTLMKPYFYPELEKKNIIPQGYIAEHSGHTRGSTVDLTLFDMKLEKEVDMGCTFDYFGMASHPDVLPGQKVGTYKPINQTQYQNRMILRNAMLRHGFRAIEEEWWHFTLKNEPYPDTYFEFPVKRY